MGGGLPGPAMPGGVVQPTISGNVAANFETL